MLAPHDFDKVRVDDVVIWDHYGDKIREAKDAGLVNVNRLQILLKKTMTKASGD